MLSLTRGWVCSHSLGGLSFPVCRPLVDGAITKLREGSPEKESMVILWLFPLFVLCGSSLKGEEDLQAGLKGQFKLEN